MIALKLGNIADFPFIDRPAEKSIQDGFDLLLELGAIVRLERNGSGVGGYRLTEKASPASIDPRLSRMLIEARKEGCLNPTARSRPC